MSETANIEPAPPRPRRRYRQFSLRTLLLIVTAFCVWFGLLSQRAHRQARAVAAVKAAHGDVHYAFEYDATGHLNREAEPPGPAWLYDALGMDYLANVVSVRLTDQLSPKDFDEVVRLPKLHTLVLLYQDLDDRDLRKLKGLTNLQVLYVMFRDKHEDALNELQLSLPDLKIKGLWEAPPN